VSNSIYSKIRDKIGTIVEIRTLDGRVIVGRLTLFNPQDNSIILEEAYEKGNRIPRVFISGSVLAQINFFDEGTEEQRFENKVKSLISADPSLSIDDIAKILNVSPLEVKRILKKISSTE
jgi:small nuclear ribonucleoprotein (snRNP)-like protein